MAHWPEIHKYCACIDLEIGIYIQSFFTVVITIAGIAKQGISYAAFWKLKNKILDLLADETYIEEHSYEEITLAKDVYFGMLIFFMIWLVLKCLFLMTILITFYAYWKKNAKLILRHIYISILHYNFEVIVGLTTALSANLIRKLIIFFYVCFQGYHILLVLTVYKKITGKSKLVTETAVRRDDNIQLPTVGFVSPHRTIRSSSATSTIQSCDSGVGTPTDYAIRPPHCSNCSCPLLQTDSQCRATFNASTTSAHPDRLVPEAKELNIKDAPLIFNQEVLRSAMSPIFEVENFGEGSSPRSNCGAAETQANSDLDSQNTVLGARPRQQTLLLKCDAEKSYPDAPVIYDSNQLNVGISPIFENRSD